MLRVILMNLIIKFFSVIICVKFSKRPVKLFAIRIICGKKVLLNWLKRCQTCQSYKSFFFYLRKYSSLFSRPLSRLRQCGINSDIFYHFNKQLTDGLMAWTQCYETFYGHNLRIFVISYNVCPWQAFLAQSVGKYRSPPYSGAPERFFKTVGSCFTSRHYTRLERLAVDKHYSLL